MDLKGQCDLLTPTEDYLECRAKVLGKCELECNCMARILSFLSLFPSERVPKSHCLSSLEGEAKGFFEMLCFPMLSSIVARKHRAKCMEGEHDWVEFGDSPA